MKQKLKILTIFFVIFSCFGIVGCEDATKLNTAVISEITSAGSKNYGVRISFFNDSRMEEKSVDVQLKFSKTGEITFWEENNDKLTFEIVEEDEWYSVTTLIAKAKDESGTEDFEKHNEAMTRTYLFNFDGNIEINIRAVAGQKTENEEETGYILVGSEPISQQFTLKIK